ncbi:DUF1513 domain-containing protein [Agarivorans sp. QJM3NY_29]|uniref:DUF1513 domain-containing protein n=1 Tax=unclassified Agarivorans TaxID=2636026 RepID=UPI003D7F0388
MMATKLNRRQLLVRLGCLSLGCGWFRPGLAAKLLLEADDAQASNMLLLGCSKQALEYQLSAVTLDGAVQYQIPLAARGHEVAVAKPEFDLAACVARRPGKFIVLFNPRHGEILDTLQPPMGMHFYGHASFSEDALRMFVTAGEQDSSEGYVLVYSRSDSATAWQLSARWPLGGLGPHQLLVLPGQRLVVAVGGIHTRGREKLNLATMRPSLIYLNSLNGEQLMRRSLADHQLSIRHLAYSAHSDTLWLACQGQDPEAEISSLVYSHHGEGPLVALDPDADYWGLFDRYVGSIACSQGEVLASSPRGAKLGVWSEAQGELSHLVQMDDVCGLAGGETTWVASTGQGQLLGQRGSGEDWRAQSPLQWDNHLNLIALP